MKPSDAGQDSFLDIVANLVGILIILVVVVGAQATSSWRAPDNTNAEAQAAELAELQDSLKKEGLEALNLQAENAELHRKLDYEQTLSARLTANRRKLMLAISEIKTEMVSRESELNQQQLAAHRVSSSVEQLKQEIQQVRYEFAAVKHHTPATEVLEHYPTPIAKTVFSDEVHFQIKNGRIAYVPMDELIAAMRREWQVKARKLEGAENTWEAVGPIEQFRMAYQLKLDANNSRNSVRQIRLNKFEIRGLSDSIGESIADALKPDSQFNSRLGRLIPHRTTVSLWVFPQDYDDLIDIRKWLRQNQFQTASWPLSHGQPISGGPSGFRTSTN